MAEREISGGWQPIATAPKDGTDVILLCKQISGHFRVPPFPVLGYASEGVWFVAYMDEPLDSDCVPTLWSPIPPLPTPPDASETEGADA